MCPTASSECDHKILSAPRNVQIDFMIRLEVHRIRPRSWATDKVLHVIPTKLSDVNKGDAKRPEYRSRLLERGDPTVPGMSAPMDRSSA